MILLAYNNSPRTGKTLATAVTSGEGNSLSKRGIGTELLAFHCSIYLKIQVKYFLKTLKIRPYLVLGQNGIEYSTVTHILVKWLVLLITGESHGVRAEKKRTPPSGEGFRLTVDFPTITLNGRWQWGNAAEFWEKERVTQEFYNQSNCPLGINVKCKQSQNTRTQWIQHSHTLVEKLASETQSFRRTK